MIILSIDTSCDETAVSLTNGRRVIANSIYSQILIHKKWGGVVPSLAKRAHEERIDAVINETIKKAHFDSRNPFNSIDFISVTQGPGLAIALEVGIQKAKELSIMHNKKLIAVNHLEGHIYSSFVENSGGNPVRDFSFPYLALIVSGGHTTLLIFKDHLTYTIIGETIDDASGEALDKGGKLLGLGYPAGPIIEQLSREVGNKEYYTFPRPMLKSKDLQFSFSGLKTSLLYFLKARKQDENVMQLKQIASSYQEAVFDTIIQKTKKAIKQTGINKLVVGGGVIANKRLRNLLRALVKEDKGSVLFPPYPYLTGDNAAMIGIAAHYKAEKNMFVENPDDLDRIPRMSL